MYRIPISFHNRLMRGEIPISYIVVQTHMGYRAYSQKELRGVFSLVGHIADGSVTADGSELAGSESAGVLEKSGRVLSFGYFERSLETIKGDVLGAYQSKTLRYMSIEMDNADSYFSRLMASEPFVTRPIYYYVGGEDDSQSKHLRYFSGIITDVTVMPTMIIEAEEAQAA